MIFFADSFSDGLKIMDWFLGGERDSLRLFCHVNRNVSRLSKITLAGCVPIDRIAQNSLKKGKILTPNTANSIFIQQRTQLNHDLFYTTLDDSVGLEDDKPLQSSVGNIMKLGKLVGSYLCDLVSHSSYQAYCNDIVLSPMVSWRN